MAPDRPPVTGPPAPAGGRILVQIPAYRDSELLPTVTDLLATARHPERLRVVIAWQHGPGDLAVGDELLRLGPVRLLATPASESRGCNWARRELQRCWDGEEYTLFLDSHHRFVPGWDVTLTRMYQQLRRTVDKPVLTGYLPPYVPARDPAGRVHAVYRMGLAERRGGLMFRLTGHPVPGWRELAGPVPARFVSLHLLFAEGRFNDVVPMDPEVYFFADEVAVALRAFTRGYDLFHPHVVLGWHLYDRATRVPHWADHPGRAARDARSLRRLRRLYDGSARGVYGVGEQRTAAEYESLVGGRLVA